MIATEKERKAIALYLYGQGVGAKGRLAKRLGCSGPIITKLLKTGEIAENKLKYINAIIAKEQPFKKTKKRK